MKTMFVNVFLVGAFISLVTPISVKYDYSTYLDSSKLYKLHWSFDRAIKMIKFATEVNTTGYVGFGLSVQLSGRMTGADIAIGWVDSNGKGHLQDFHGVGESRPKLDEDQNYKLLKAEESNGVTTLHFERAFDTCDFKNDHKISEGTIKIIWAYSPIDPKEGDMSTFRYHTSKRGSKSINFLNHVKDSPRPSGPKYFELVQSVIHVNQGSNYKCFLLKMPNLGGRKHIIEIEPALQRGIEGIVQQIIIYECASNMSEQHLNKTMACHNYLPSDELRKCQQGAIAFAWSFGGKNFKFPSHVGLGVGGPSDMLYVLMEIRYDYYGRTQENSDSSGLRFYYTDQLRKYDASTLYVGHVANNQLVIPPHERHWVVTGTCPSSVTKRTGLIKSNMTNNAIKIFSVFPYAHLTGRAMWLKHVKEDGTEYPEIIRDDNYDYKYMATGLLAEERTFTPGDALTAYCQYNTATRLTPIIGGVQPRSEMCYFFVMYYPKQSNFSSCSSYYNESMDIFLKKAWILFSVD